MENSYPAKLLLFGEYTIIENSLALAVPCSLYSGNWRIDAALKRENIVIESKKSLEKLLAYLEKLNTEGALKSSIDLKKFSNDLENGLWFDASIPSGYGLGSSGAVCAGIYERYCQQPLRELSLLKEELAKMESCFHGKSSGIDPLVSYLRQAVLIKAKDEIELRTDFQPQENKGRGAIFLINTTISRATTPLVQSYFKLLENDHFKQNCTIPLIKLVNNAIYAILGKEYAVLMENVRNISEIQYRQMSYFIPDAFKPIWKQGLVTDLYSLKLCGAGGGGFILGFTMDWAETNKLLCGLDCIRLYAL